MTEIIRSTFEQARARSGSVWIPAGFILRCVQCNCTYGKRSEVKVCHFECVCHAEGGALVVPPTGP